MSQNCSCDHGADSQHTESRTQLHAVLPENSVLQIQRYEGCSAKSFRKGSVLYAGGGFT